MSTTPWVSKHAGFGGAVALGRAFIAAQDLIQPDMADSPRLKSTGLYTWRTLQDPGRVLVNVAVTATVVNHPTTMRQSRPGWRIDRTVYGVVQHEIGHHVWRYATRSAHHKWRTVLRRIPKAARVSGYEPVPEEAFAETCRVFVLNPDLLKLALPGRYHCLTTTFGLVPTETRDWHDILPATFHDRAAQWIDRMAAL
jgi:hypothetical protein